MALPLIFFELFTYGRPSFPSQHDSGRTARFRRLPSVEPTPLLVLVLKQTCDRPLVTQGMGKNFAYTLLLTC